MQDQQVLSASPAVTAKNFFANLAPSIRSRPPAEDAMAKGQMRTNKEKKKPKADKDKPKTHISAYKAAQQTSNPAGNPFAKKN